MKRFLIISIVLGLLAGCGDRIDPQPKETFTIDGFTVEFSPPPPEWKKHLQELGNVPAVDLGGPSPDTVIAVRFDHPGGKGHLAVTHIRQNRKIEKPSVTNEKTGEVTDAVLGDFVKIEDDKTTLNHIAAQVFKREGGEIVNKPGEYITVDGENAYMMEYRFGKGEHQEHGIQVHLTKMGRHFEIVLNVPESQFAAAKPVFKQVLETFRVKEKVGRPTDAYEDLEPEANKPAK